MSPFWHTLLIGLLITCPGFAQISGASLASLTSVDLTEKNSDVERENSFGADQFLSYSLNASIVKRSLAKLATEHGSSEEIRSLGSLMMKAESDVFGKIKQLAVKRHVRMPAKTIGDATGLADIPKDQSTDFDKKFLTEVIRVLEQDIEMLRRGSECEDRWVRLLASEHLVRTEYQLAQLKLIKEKSD